ncbi:MAG: transcriptional regulator, ArsR family [Anaerocolumna sp.]|nr:transcriptional regulator, ArsR family [Anaerocolumna sp.]
MEIKAYKLLTEPNWDYELVNTIVETLGNSEKETSNSQIANEFAVILKNIYEYKEKVLEGVLPMLENYPDIKPLFEFTSLEKDNRARPILVNLTSQKKLHAGMSKEEMDAIMLEGVEDWAKSVSGEYRDVKIENLSELIEFLKDLETEDSVKMKMITIYSERYTLLPRAQQFIAEAIKILQEFYPIVEEEFEEAILSLQDKSYLESNLKELGLIKFGKCNQMVVQPCILPYNQIAVDWRDEEEKDVAADIGIYVFRLSSTHKKIALSDSKILSALKTLGDATRLKIVRMLFGRKMYIQEIADVLGLTPATVSHHINLLLQEGFVCVTVDVEKAKKIFYEINPEKFNELGDAVKQLGLEALGTDRKGDGL